MNRSSYRLKIFATASLLLLGAAVSAQELDTLKLTKSLQESGPIILSPEPGAGIKEVEAFDDVLSITESDLWNRIRSGYAIPNLENQLVTFQTNWYSSRIDYLLRTIQRGSRYLYHVVDALDKRGMPTDLALLPFIESAFNPQAISSAKASGMWQFMPATGRDFNLRQNIFKDDRRGVLDSTEAALDYLQRLYGIFGDWQLALAAYNWGEGSVQRAIKRQQALGLPIDFDSLSALMPKETKNYVPKLQAVKNIIGHPERFSIVLPRLDNLPYFTSIMKTRDIDVNLAAKLAEIPISEFKALNPQFSRPVITGGNKTSILLPIENAALFESNFLSWKGPLSSWTTLNVNKTEKVESLASRFGYKADLLREVNAIPAKMLVKAGSTIIVPKSAKSLEENISTQLAEQAQLTIEKPHVATRKSRIKVGRHDSLASIAKRHKVTVAELRAWNKLRNDQLKLGQNLEIQTPISVSHASRSTKDRSRKIASHRPQTKSTAKPHKIAKAAATKKTALSHNKRPHKNV